MFTKPTGCWSSSSRWSSDTGNASNYFGSGAMRPLLCPMSMTTARKSTSHNSSGCPCMKSCERSWNRKQIAARWAGHQVRGQGEIIRVPLPGRELEETPPGGVQGRVAQRRAFPQDGFHRDQLHSSCLAGVQAYNGRANVENRIKEAKNTLR